LGIFQSLKLRISIEKILLIYLKLHFTPNTLGCYGLSYKIKIKQVDTVFLDLQKLDLVCKCRKKKGGGTCQYLEMTTGVVVPEKLSGLII